MLVFSFGVWENMTGKCDDLEGVHARPVRDRSSLRLIPSEEPARATEKRCAGYPPVGMSRLDVDGHNSLRYATRHLQFQFSSLR